jgi:2'-5' RNA ligase
MRLFISINLDRETKEKLFLILSELKERISKKYPYNIRWENKDNFHLTLFFIGETDEKMKTEIISALEKIRIKDTDEIILKGISIDAFPSMKNPRVLFVSLDDENKVIEKLYMKIAAAMDNLGFKPDKKFHSHITLGRMKHQTGIRFIEPQNDIDCSFTYSSKTFSLMQSTLTSEGAVHKVIQDFPFNSNS